LYDEFHKVIDATYKRATREGYKPIILGDLNADTCRMKYVNDRVLSNWLRKHKYLELSRIYAQAVPNTFLSSRGQYSWIDHFIISETRKDEVLEIFLEKKIF
jgi:hypothetical protein